MQRKMVRVAAAGQARERSGKDMSSKEKEKRDFPRNIRQIGDPGKEKRIYLEDYAVAYLREVKGAVLFGELVRIKGARCYFISGAVEVPEGDFSEENWNYVTEEAGKSFEGLSVIGWVPAGRGDSGGIKRGGHACIQRTFSGKRGSFGCIQ